MKDTEIIKRCEKRKKGKKIKKMLRKEQAMSERRSLWIKRKQSLKPTVKRATGREREKEKRY